MVRFLRSLSSFQSCIRNLCAAANVKRCEVLKVLQLYQCRVSYRGATKVKNCEILKVLQLQVLQILGRRVSPTYRQSKARTKPGPAAIWEDWRPVFY